ncbi:MAG: hypothetical protein CVU71_17350 [Deltaproteobacteria bacterium HGW-Deltaproteobacteria-6]|nr:MAG: hypothetical protein CVU71_17350 [Deltaproteobacteria bacterium HGW-Deltaproteobacteria-6]
MLPDLKHEAPLNFQRGFFVVCDSVKCHRHSLSFAYAECIRLMPDALQLQSLRPVKKLASPLKLRAPCLWRVLRGRRI